MSKSKLKSYRIINAEERAELHPGRMRIPSVEQRRALSFEFVAKIGLEIDPPPAMGPTGETIWVAIERRDERSGNVEYRGRAITESTVIGLEVGASVVFNPWHVYDYKLAEAERPVVTAFDAAPLGVFANEGGQAGDPVKRS